MHRFLALAALPLLLTACDSGDEGTQVTTAQNPQSGEAETVIEADNGWRLTSSQSAGATAVFGTGEPRTEQVAISCPIRGLIEVSLAGAVPLASEEKLELGFGAGAPIALNAVATVDRNGANSPIKGAMKAAGPAPEGLRAMMQDGEITVRYGARSYGPFPAFPENVRQRMINEC